MFKKVFLKTFGCQMNVRDSEFVMGILLDEGFARANSLSGADIVLFNSCSVRRRAEERLFSNIADLKEMKKKRPGLVIGLMGCTAQSYKDKVMERVPIVDFVCGPGNEADLPGIIKDVLKNRCPIVATDKPDDKRPELFPGYRTEKFKAHVSISEGCDNFCSYCIVPYVRGRERSRRPEDIIREVKDLAARGFKEITLLGQNVNSYGKGQVAGSKGQGFIKLLEEINKVQGIERVRFMTSHPKDASIDLFKAIRDLDKVCEHLHLPFQSGSDKILRLMNRKYTVKRYLKLAEDYKRIVPDGSLTTDVVVGFPSETRRDFQHTVDVMRNIRFDTAFAFKYSARPPARSARLKDSISKEEKEGRLKAVLDLQNETSLERNLPLEGKVLEVLVDGVNKKDTSMMAGRTRTNKVAVFKGEGRLIGRLVDIRINSAAPYVLKGRRVWISSKLEAGSSTEK